VERHDSAHDRPRAVSFDDEVARLLDSTETGKGLRETPSRQTTTSGGTPRAKSSCSSSTPRPDSTAGRCPRGSTSPRYRSCSTGACARSRTSQCCGGTARPRFEESGQAVTLTIEDPDGTSTVLRSSWLVGCDGANVLNRNCLGGPNTDLGFSYDWLIVDGTLHEPRTLSPRNLERCDPPRSVTDVSTSTRRIGCSCPPTSRQATRASFGTPSTSLGRWAERWRRRTLVPGRRRSTPHATVSRAGPVRGSATPPTSPGSSTW
jgi:flavoprotein hydroxylase